MTLSESEVSFNRGRGVSISDQVFPKRDASGDTNPLRDADVQKSTDAPPRLRAVPGAARQRPARDHTGRPSSSRSETARPSARRRARQGTKVSLQGCNIHHCSDGVYVYGKVRCAPPPERGPRPRSSCRALPAWSGPRPSSMRKSGYCRDL